MKHFNVFFWKIKSAGIINLLFRLPFLVFKNHFFNTGISVKNPYIWGDKFQKLKVKWILFST